VIFFLHLLGAHHGTISFLVIRCTLTDPLLTRIDRPTFTLNVFVFGPRGDSHSSWHSRRFFNRHEADSFLSTSAQSRSSVDQSIYSSIQSTLLSHSLNVVVRSFFPFFNDVAVGLLPLARRIISSECWMKRSAGAIVAVNQFTRNYGGVVVATVATACGGS